MEKLADISQFEALSNNAELHIYNPSVIENDGFDMISNPDGTVSGGGVPPVANIPDIRDPNFIPQWGKSLSDRVNGLETRMSRVEANMATKEEMQTGFARLEELIRNK